jgi:hypothetical protein
VSCVVRSKTEMPGFIKLQLATLKAKAPSGERPHALEGHLPVDRARVKAKGSIGRRHTRSLDRAVRRAAPMSGLCSTDRWIEIYSAAAWPSTLPDIRLRGLSDNFNV